MSREQEIADLLWADATIQSLLVGGVYTDEGVGIEGIHRGEDSSTNSVFDAEGYLRPTALVRQRSLIPMGSIRSQKDKITAVSQAVEIYFYQYRRHDVIELAKERAYEILEGVRLSDSYPLTWVGESPYFYDVGPVYRSLTLRQEWLVVSVRQPSA